MEVSVGDCIAGAAFAFSIFTLWRQRKFDARVKWLNELLIEREEGDVLAAQRADVSASIVKPQKHSYQLRIYNRGKASARNVNVAVLAGEPLFRSSDMSRKLPYPILDVHGSFNLDLTVHMQSPPRMKIRIEWEDDVSGGSKELTLDVY